MTNERTQPFTVIELASTAGVTETYVRRLLRQGKLSGQKFGRDWLIPADVGRAWLHERAERERAERERWEKY